MHTQPHHFHHPGAVSPPPMNYQTLDNNNAAFPPPPPPLSTTISNMQSATSSNTFRSNPKLTANAIPRPYPGSPVGGGIGSAGISSIGTNGGGRLPSNPTSPITPANKYQQSFENSSTTTSTTNLQQQKSGGTGPNQNLEACVQDLHDKTFGQGGVVQITGANSSYPGQNYEGYTSR